MSLLGLLGVFFVGGMVVLAVDFSVMFCFLLIEKYQVNVIVLVLFAVSLWLQVLIEGESWVQFVLLKLLQVGGVCFFVIFAVCIFVEIGCQLQQVFGMVEGLVNYI